MCVLHALQAAAAQKGQEVRELNHMLKAWEAMRLGKDAQVRGKAELASWPALVAQSWSCRWQHPYHTAGLHLMAAHVQHNIQKLCNEQ